MNTESQELCPVCGGKGSQPLRRLWWTFWLLRERKLCNACGGTGKKKKTPNIVSKPKAEIPKVSLQDLDLDLTLDSGTHSVDVDPTKN